MIYAEAGRKDRAGGAPNEDTAIGAKSVGDDVRRARVAHRKVALQELNGEADEHTQYDRYRFGSPDLARRQTSAKANAKGNEPDNGLRKRIPVSPGHTEFFPKRLEKS
jgi:hypothetical protein